MLPDLTGDARWAVPVRERSAYLESTVKEREHHMLKDLAASGLRPDQLRAYVDDIMPLELKDGKVAKGGYYIPYFNLDGSIMRSGGGLTMYRIRLYGAAQRYSQPTATALQEFGLPTAIPYVLPQVHDYAKEQQTLYICEGEKKAACVMDVLGVAAIGIGGCWNWGIKKKLHPWIKELITMHGVSKVVVIPDGDINRYDICTAYGTLADQLRLLGVGVDLVRLPDPEDKIDDLLVGWGIEAEGWFSTLPKFSGAELVVDQSTLAMQYGLSTVGKDPKIAINDTNVHRLLGHHPAFSAGWWTNTDNNTQHLGSEQIDWQRKDYQITCYMQHYFGMHNLNRPRVRESMQELCLENSRSPFVDWIRSKDWDNTDRLSDWAIRLWGCPDTPTTREVSTKFMVGMCARMMDPGCKMDWMMVTLGGQGIGKSWWASLVTKGNSITFMASGNAKDDAAKMHKGLVVCIDELDAFNKRDMTYWKTMITTKVDTYRPPYGVAEVTMPRRSVLYGTSNHRTFLRHDDTGQRRFGVLEPSRMLDVAGFKDELQQLWAQALVFWEQDTVPYYELSMEVREQSASEYSGDDPLIEQVQTWLSQWPADRFKMVSLLEGLGMNNHVQNRGITGPLKDIMVSRGWVTYHAKNLRVAGSPPGSGYVINRELVPQNELLGGM